MIPLLCDLGMTSYDGPGAGSEHDYPVMLDGLLIGWLRPEVVGQVADSLRVMKVKGINKASVFPPRSPNFGYCELNVLL